MTNIDNNQDILDVRDIIARFEELETELDEAKGGESTQAEEMGLDDWIAGLRVSEHPFCDAIEEYVLLRDLLEEMKGNGGDEQWRGDWYPVTMIRDSYFEDSMDEMISDCYSIDQYKLPSFMTIKIDYEALQMDYTSVEYDGTTYWYR